VIFKKIIGAAIAIAGADCGDIQIFDPRSGAPKIRAQHGFEPWWAEFWDGAADAGSRGLAIRRAQRIIIEDVEHSPIIDPAVLAIKRRAGIRAVVVTPLVSRSGRMLGTLSTHYKSLHRPDDRELRLVDLLCRQAADLIDRENAEQIETALRRRFEARDRV